MCDLGDVPVLLCAAVLVHGGLPGCSGQQPGCWPLESALPAAAASPGSRWCCPALPGRVICVVAAVGAGKELRSLPCRRDLDHQAPQERRLARDAATAHRGRPRVKGVRLPALDRVVATAAFTPVTVTRYRKPPPCRPPLSPAGGTRSSAPARLGRLLVRGRYGVATDGRPPVPRPSNGMLPGGALEVGYRGRKEVCGTGRARNRTALAIRATVPFTLTCQSPAVIWYATAGHDPPTSLSTRHAPPGMPPTGVHRGQIRGRRPVLCPV